MDSGNLLTRLIFQSGGATREHQWSNDSRSGPQRGCLEAKQAVVGVLLRCRDCFLLGNGAHVILSSFHRPTPRRKYVARDDGIHLRGHEGDLDCITESDFLTAIHLRGNPKNLESGLSKKMRPRWPCDVLQAVYPKDMGSSENKSGSTANQTDRTRTPVSSDVCNRMMVLSFQARMHDKIESVGGDTLWQPNHPGLRMELLRVSAEVPFRGNGKRRQNQAAGSSYSGRTYAIPVADHTLNPPLFQGKMLDDLICEFASLPPRIFSEGRRPHALLLDLLDHHRIVGRVCGGQHSSQLYAS